MRCKTCRYDLSKLSEHRCPECGQAFDPGDPTTFVAERKPEPKLNHVKRALLAIICAPFVNWVILFIIFLAQRDPGGMFGNVRSQIAFAAIVAISFWQFWLLTALVLYLLFETINIMRTKKGPTRVDP